MSISKNLIFSMGYQVTQNFGENPQIYSKLGMIAHNGIDLIPADGSFGAAIYCPVKGTVIKKSYDPNGYGNFIMVWCKEENIALRFCHFAQPSGFNVGDTVEANEDVGIMGSTGFSTGEHLHFEVIPVDGNGSKAEPNNGYYGAVDPQPYLDKWQQQLDKYNAPVAESKPVAEEPKKLTAKEGFDYILKYYPEFKSDVDNGWPIARFDIDGVGEGIKMLAYSVIQPLFNRAENLQKLIDLKAATPTVEVKKNESQSQFEPVAKVITNEEEIKKLQTQILIAQSQKDREALENNPLVIKSQQPLEATQTFKVGTAGSIISLIGVAVTNFTDQIKSIPGLGNIGEFLANNQCNLSYLIIMFLGLVILFMLYHKNLTQNLIKDNIAQIVDTKTVNFDEIIKNISNNIDKVSNISNQASDVLKQIDDVKTKTSSIFKK
jgi:Peptidase family M23